LGHWVDIPNFSFIKPTNPYHFSEKLREKLRQEFLRKGTELAHGVADTLFAVPPTEDLDGPIVHLPSPAVRLPREKHLDAGTSLPGLVAAKSFGSCGGYIVASK
ncbi:hypothetical protein ACJX0J_020517, partial [Zea mays]